jgi:hypothetical protein
MERVLFTNREHAHSGTLPGTLERTVTVRLASEKHPMMGWCVAMRRPLLRRGAAGVLRNVKDLWGRGLSQFAASGLVNAATAGTSAPLQQLQGPAVRLAPEVPLQHPGERGVGAGHLRKQGHG